MHVFPHFLIPCVQEVMQYRRKDVEYVLCVCMFVCGGKIKDDFFQMSLMMGFSFEREQNINHIDINSFQLNIN